MTQQSNDQNARLDRLERENRLMKRIGGGLVAAVAAIGLMSASSALCKTVWAERLVLRDGSGNDRLLMDAYSGAPTITMRDEKGKSIARFTWQDGVAMETLDAQGNTTGKISVDKNGKVRNASHGEADYVGMIR